MLLNAFSKSEKKIRPGLFSSSALSIISKSRRMFSPVYVPFINPFRELCIILTLVNVYVGLLVFTRIAGTS